MSWGGLEWIFSWWSKKALNQHDNGKKKSCGSVPQNSVAQKCTAPLTHHADAFLGNNVTHTLTVDSLLFDRLIVLYFEVLCMKNV